MAVTPRDAAAGRCCPAPRHPSEYLDEAEGKHEDRHERTARAVLLAAVLLVCADATAQTADPVVLEGPIVGPGPLFVPDARGGTVDFRGGRRVSLRRILRSGTFSRQALLGAIVRDPA